MTKKGVCAFGRIFYGIVTISEKGQIALPVDIRRDLNIKTGDRLVVLKRKDSAGIILLKQNIMDSIMIKIRDEEDFFKKMDKKKGGD